MVLWHHECFGGDGYPQGLKGDVIPLVARIFALIDALDAMTHDRPYSRGRSFPEARQEIIACSGSQFDPQVVEVFLSIPEEEWVQLLT